MKERFGDKVRFRRLRAAPAAAARASARSWRSDALAGDRGARALSRGSGSDVIFKIVTLFLVVMVVLAMFGKLRLPGAEAPGLDQMPALRPLPDRQGPLPLRDKG